MDALRHVMATRTMLMRDAEGRPLGEGKTGPERMSGVVFELRTCPYPGSRHHHARPMNLSALRQVSVHWPGVCGALSYLHGLHRGSAGSSPPCIADVWRVGHMTNAIADFAFMRTWQPVADGELPAAIGALYKVTLGVTSTAYKAWSDGAVRFTTPTSADFVVDYAERHGQLIGPEQVCGGSETMIRELLTIAVEGGPSGAGAREAARVVGDEARFVQFCDATAALRLLRFAIERLDAALRSQLAVEVGAQLFARAQPTFCGGQDPSMRAGLVTLDRGEQLAALDDLIGQAADPRFSITAELGAGMRALRDRWAGGRGLRSAAVDAVVAASDIVAALSPSARGCVANHLARYLEIERTAAPIVRSLKSMIAATLGIDLAAPIARERGLVSFVPLRPAGPSMRAMLRDELGITVSAPDGDVMVACGIARCVVPA